MVARILPSRDLVRETLSYNSETGTFVWLPKPLHMFPDERAFKSWNTRFAGKPAGGQRKGKHYSTIHIIGHGYYLTHQIVWLFHYGCPLPSMIDHADGDLTNNRLSNLRAATRSENQWNSGPQRNNPLGVKGVSERKGRYTARIMRHRKKTHIGSFDTLEEAAEAYRKVAVRLHGKFARFD
jgi:hypothetical protein